MSTMSSSGRRGGSDFDPDTLVALCRACHDQTDAPFIKGRLIVAAIGGARFTFERIYAASKWERRAITGTQYEPKSTPAATSSPALDDHKSYGFGSYGVMR